MREEEKRVLSGQLSAVLQGADPLSMDWPEELNAYGWRLIRWEADVPLKDEERQSLQEALPGVMALCGTAGCSFSEDGDALTIFLCLTAFPARAHRETALWLSAHALMEFCSVTLEQEGTLMIGEEFNSPVFWQEAVSPMREISDWWAHTSPIPEKEAFRHRSGLQTMIKRRQYGTLGGYITRVLRSETEINRVCFAFVPLVIEAVWNQHSELSLARLTEELNLNEMTRRPREALLAWVSSLQPRLQSCPTANAAAPIEKVIAGIQTDCSLPYSQANLSRSLGLTPAYFCRLFHEKTGQHFSAYLTMTRMTRAQDLLSVEEPMPLQEISQACGYPNKSYFCQVFRKYTGMTPGEFEQEQKNKRERS